MLQCGDLRCSTTRQHSPILRYSALLRYSAQATRWLSWYGVGLASADRLPVVRIPAGPLASLKCDPPKGNGRRPKKNNSATPCYVLIQVSNVAENFGV